LKIGLVSAADDEFHRHGAWDGESFLRKRFKPILGCNGAPQTFD
jgi:hypothetical protein